MIDPRAVVAPDAELADGIEIGAYTIVGAGVRIGAGTRIFPFASIGHPPQDMKYAGEPSRLEIGRNNTIREHVTMNPGTKGGGMVTKVGDNGLFMVACHVAHDCVIGNNVIMANNATLGGHVHIGDFAILGGLAAVHQFVRIGAHAIVGGMSGVEHDVIPYGSVMGDRAHLVGLNIIGLKRRGFSRDVIHVLRNAYRLLFAQEGTLGERLSDVSQMFPENEAVMDIVRFMQAQSQRAICQPKDERAAS